MKAIQMRCFLIASVIVLIHLTSFATYIKKAQHDPWNQFYFDLKRDIGYPAAAIESKVQGYVQIKFRIKSDDVQDLSIVGRPLGYGLDEAVMKAISEFNGYKTLPNGKYSVVVAFQIAGLDDYGMAPDKVDGYKSLNLVNKTINTNRFKPVIDENGEDNHIYSFVVLETQPSFPGGPKGFMNYIKKEMNYSGDARGKVFLSFTVEKDGSLTNISVDRRLGSGADEEALRLLKNSPKWAPGIMKGKPTRVRYNIPILFDM